MDIEHIYSFSLIIEEYNKDVWDVDYNRILYRCNSNIKVNQDKISYLDYFFLAFSLYFIAIVRRILTRLSLVSYSKQYKRTFFREIIFFE